MESQKPKSIKAIGLLLVILSVLITLSNGMAAIAWSVLRVGEDLAGDIHQTTGGLAFVAEHYVAMCVLMVVIGIAYCLGGIFLMKYRLWAHRVTTSLTLLLILLILVFSGTCAHMFMQEGDDDGILFGICCIVGGLFWSIPFTLLFWHLNRQKIKMHFE